jgi:catechol 2,3-dioxygenase-like lactoylglutathione lyase family enzyme
MYDHIGLRVKDLKTAVGFYKATLEPLGYVLDDSGTGFGPKGQPGLWLHGGAGLKAGGRDNGGPGVRADYSPNYYAAFLVDPDGNNVEAVCLE